MKIDLPRPAIRVERITHKGGGVTSPYARPPMAPVFVIGMRDGGTITLSEEEALELHVALSEWVDGLPGRKDRIADSLKEPS
jgi:hypothetical protein